MNVQNRPALANKPAKKANSQSGIAIIGVSGRFPGGANSPDLLWDALISGKDGITEADGSRWDLGWHNDDKERGNRLYTKCGGFLDQIDEFDAEFFGISPREAQQVDPQQRLLLELAWEAFENAGIPLKEASGSETGVFVGISSTDYKALTNAGYPDAYSNTGSALSIAANRISYILDLHGPSFAVDTACSSSLVGLHQACLAIQNGECSMALAGGASILSDIEPWLGFARASMLSPDGRCKSFDENGNGYVRAEGGGLVLLKPLENAERDGDNILGVIRGTGVNSDGRTLGISMPNGDAQEALLRRVYDEAGIDAEDVFYVEAHGTGTSVGDPIECGSLGRVLGTPRENGSTCLIGSVKSNIGHLEPASGIAGLTKVLMAIKNRKIPANLHFDTPNPKIEFEEWKLKVVDEAIEIPESDKPLAFGVNSFGFGGTNAHVVLEEYKPQAVKAAVTKADAPFLFLSANSKDALREIAQNYSQMLKAPDADWTTIASAAATCRSPLRDRLVVPASSASEAADLLDRWIADETVPAVGTGSSNAPTATTGFVFSGNGPQWWGMGRELLAENAIFRAEIEKIDAIFEPLSGWSLVAEMARAEADSRIELTEVAQPMLFAVQMALTAVFADAGIRPAAVMGHSVGEVAAACASGALTLEAATKVIFLRSREQAKTAGSGKMAAVGIDPETAQEEIAKLDGWIELAAVNSPNAVTVAGDEAVLQVFVDKMVADGHFARMLKLDYPFHTKAMDPIEADLKAALADLAVSKSDVPFVSTVHGTTVEGEALDANYWFQNVRAPVLFGDAVETLISEHEVNLFLEIGPHPVLKDYIAQVARGLSAPATALPTLKRPGKAGPESDVENLGTALASSYAYGATPIEAIFTKPAALPDLPLYPWQRSRHWRGTAFLPDYDMPAYKDHPLLGGRFNSVDGRWENPIDDNLLAYLKDHVVQNSVVFPAAGYIEMSLSAALKVHGEGTVDLESFEILRPLVLPENSDPLVQVSLDARDGSVEIAARKDRDAKDFVVQTRGRTSHSDVIEGTSVDLAAIKARMIEDVTAEDHYADASWRGLDYGPCFQGISSIALADPQAQVREALGHVNLDFLKDGGLEEYRSHPALFDSCLQTAIALVAQNDPRQISTIPVQVGRIRSFAPLGAELYCHVVIKRESMRSVVFDMHIIGTDGALLMSLSEARCQKANLAVTAVSPLTADWWRPDPSAPSLGDLAPLPAPAAVAQALDASGNDADADVRATLNKIAALYAVRALDELRPAGDKFDVSSISRAARIRRDQTAALQQVISIAETSGHVTAEGRGWVWNAQDDGTDVDALWAEALLAHPQYQAELLALAQAGEGLAERLRGTKEPINPALLEQLKDSAPSASVVNGLARSAVAQIVAEWPADRPLRVLEVGGGNGGQTAWVLPSLPADRTDYLFTDSSEANVARVERRFGSHKFLRGNVLETGAKLDDQGQPRGYFDLVIAPSIGAINGNISATLANIRPVMADGAVLIAAAAPTDAFSTLIGGNRPALAQAEFEKAGLTEFAETDGAARIVIAKRVKAQDPATIAPEGQAMSLLVLAEDPDADLARELKSVLGAVNQTVRVEPFLREGDAKADLIALLSEATPDKVVVLAGRASDGDAYTKQLNRTMGISNLVAALEEARSVVDADLAIVTRGAFTTANGQGPIDPSEAVLFGLGRVIGNEHQGLNCRLVDFHSTDESAAQAQWLGAELLRGDDETEVQINNGLRYVNRAVVRSESDEARASGKTGGAYALDFVPQGGIDSLYLRALERKAPGATEVEIAVKAAGLNFRDVLWCMGMLPEEAVEHGFSGPTIGMECAGEVVRVGSDVTHLKEGDRVFAFASSCFGSHVTTDAGSAGKIPDGIAYPAAATVPTTFLTAWYGLDHLARLEEGESILIHGAAGGVGLAAIQIAKMKGATVFGTAGSPQKRAMLRKLGVDHVLNSRTLEFADKVMEITQGKGVDVVLNSLAGEAITKSLACLRPFGRFLEIGKVDFYANSKMGLRPFRNNLSYFGIDADTLLIERPALAQRLFNQVIDHFGTGALRPLPHQVVPVSRAGEAFRSMQAAKHVGKIVISTEVDRPETLAIVPSNNPVRAGGTYLVTGGLAGFGFATARWLAQEGASSLALVSRSGAKSDEAKANVAELEAMGVKVQAIAADVSDKASVDAVLKTVRGDMEPLIGVIHSAAVIEDAPILTLEPDQIAKVYQAKMMGAAHLDQLTREDAIEMFVLFSSASAVVGNPGQSAYVGANLYLDALAMARKADGLPALSVGWGAILDAGFLTRHENVKDMLKSRTGLDATPSRDALDDLGRISALGSHRISVARFDLARVHQVLPSARKPRFEPIMPIGAAGAGAEESLADLIETMPKGERLGFILERVKENAAKVLGTSASQISDEQSLSSLGLDSLMAVELAGIIERDVGDTVPVMQLLSAESLKDVADLVADILGIGGGSGDDPDAASKKEPAKV